MFSKYIRCFNVLPVMFTLSVGIAPIDAYAVFIDFDDIVAPPFNPFGCPTDIPPCGLILSNEYESKGLTFSGSSNWLSGETLPDGSNQNRLVGINTISLSFTAIRPNFISFNINSALDHEASFIEVWSESGHLFTRTTSGRLGINEGTPYIPNEFISFYAPEAITHINITSLYNNRLGPDIDNLTFEWQEVPESSPFLLLIPGIFALIWKRSRSNRM